MIDEQRYARWRRASFAFLQFEPHLLNTVQELGRIDAELFFRDVRYREIRERHDGTPEEWAELAGHSFTMAYLWVLGAYEVIRTLDQRFREIGLHEMGVYQGSKPLKHIFERVRIPLAKLEPAGRHKDTDRYFAMPVLIAGRGIGWTVADGVHICRSDLSTQFLDFLEGIRIPPPSPVVSP
jgi:hypothetical protein